MALNSIFKNLHGFQNASSHVLPVQQGEIVIKVNELSLCHVGGVGGNTKNGLLSLQAADVQLHHCGIEMSFIRPPWRFGLTCLFELT